MIQQPLLNNNSFKAIVWFYVIAYSITWLLWSPYYLPVFPSSWSQMPIFHLLGSYGPLCSACICTYFLNGKQEFRTLLRQLFSFRKVSYLLFAFLIPFIILLLSVLLTMKQNFLLFDWGSIFYNKEIGTYSPVIWILINVGIYGLGEETGWRGYALPRFQKRYNALVSSCIVAMLWALWHWPLFFYSNSGYYHMDIYGVMGWLFSILTGSVILTWIFNSSGGSIPACIIFHGTMEVAFVTGNNAAQVAQYSGIIVTIAGVLILLIAKPANLSLNARVTNFRSE